MLKKFLTLSITTLFLMNATAAYADRVSAAERQKNEANNSVEVWPSVPYDPQLAVEMLAEGESLIRGALYHNRTENYTSSAISEAQVSLYPATPHMTEWAKNFNDIEKIKFRPKKLIPFSGLRKSPQKIAQFDEAALEHRLIAKTDEYGLFTFTQMKPGTYIAVSTFHHIGQYSGTRQVGTSQTDYGYYGTTTTQHYEPTTYTYSEELFAIEFVEILPGETDVKLNLKLAPYRQQ